MAKCHQCRKDNAELLTMWERFRYWLFNRFNHAFFPQDFDDLKSEKYTQGYSDGYVSGIKEQRVREEAQMKKYGY